MAKLVLDGLDRDAAEALMRTRWSESGQKNLATAWNQWVKHCDALAARTPPVIIDRLEPSPPQLVNFLRAIRDGIYREGSKAGVAVKAGWVRAVRSAVSTTIALWSHHSSIGSPLR